LGFDLVHRTGEVWAEEGLLATVADHVAASWWTVIERTRCHGDGAVGNVVCKGGEGGKKGDEREMQGPLGLVDDLDSLFRTFFSLQLKAILMAAIIKQGIPIARLRCGLDITGPSLQSHRHTPIWTASRSFSQSNVRRQPTDEGQPSPAPRMYRYYIDVHGQLFLHDTTPKVG